MGCQTSDLQEPPHQIKPQQLEQLKNQAIIMIEDGNQSESMKIGDLLLEDRKWDEAAAIYKKIIELNPDFDYQIDGLGCREEIISYYEWDVNVWYKNNKEEHKIKGTPYDALSLCLSQMTIDEVDKFKQWKKWYEQLLQSHPHNYQLHYGLGNLLYNNAIYEEALVAYTKTIGLKPSLVNPYIDTAFVYQYRRIQKKKAIEWATKALAIDPNNEYGLFLIARNQKQTKAKIQKLKVVADRFPTYTRIANDIGIAYRSGLNNCQQAIIWYKRCVQYSPKYASCYNNTGVAYEILKNYEEAKNWYFKACQRDSQYKAAHKNLTDIFDTLKTKDEDIILESQSYNIKRGYFEYYIGLSYYDKKQVTKSIVWYKRALQQYKNSYEVYNSLGISFDENKQYDLALQNYHKAIELKPDYHMAYYNMGIIYANRKDLDTAIKWYKKAIQYNPRYHKAHNNLGNIYKDRNQDQQAIKCYAKAVEHNSTYTLGWVNMGVCYLKIYNYKEAFNSINRAQQIFPTDNNNMSQGNKAFLKEQIAKFQTEGENWKRTGSIDPQMRQRLNGLIKQFEEKFKSLYSGIPAKNTSVNQEKILKKEIIAIVRKMHEDKFELTSIDQIFNLVRAIFHEDEEYFHIIPQLFIQYFWKHAFEGKEPIQKLQQTLKGIIHSQAVSFASQNDQKQNTPIADQIVIKCNNFSPSNDCKVNLFKESAFFANYEQLYSQIDKVNASSKLSLTQFATLVEDVRKESKGLPVGTCMKIPQKSQEQFKVILRILEKMLKKQINEERVKIIIKKIDERLKKASKVTLVTVVHEIMQTWTNEITEILSNRQNNKIITECNISDLVRGKCMFNRAQDIAKAVNAADILCKQRGYEIIELDNRLSKKQTMDVVLKIRIKEAVCEFQLALKQDESRYHFIHSIYEIERSPLGCIFGSYLFMSKGFKYPLIANCNDIANKLKSSTKDQDVKIVKAAQFIVDALKQK